MKTQEEIKQLAESIYGKGKVEDYEEGFIDGYNQCQEDMAKKYAEDDMLKCWNTAHKMAEQYYKKTFKQD